MAEEKKLQLTITNEKLIEKVENYAAYGFSSRREFVCAAILAYENTLVADERTEMFAKVFAGEIAKILKEKERTAGHERLENEYL